MHYRYNPLETALEDAAIPPLSHWLAYGTGFLEPVRAARPDASAPNAAIDDVTNAADQVGNNNASCNRTPHSGPPAGVSK